MSDLNAFEPDWTSPPGDTILDTLEGRGWKQKDFAKRAGWSSKHVSLMINGKASITEETAMILELVLGISARFWLAREAEYRSELLRLEQYEKYAQWQGWLDRVPVGELMGNGYIAEAAQTRKNKPRIVGEALKFYSVASPRQWEACLKDVERLFPAAERRRRDMGAVAALLCAGEMEAEDQGDPPKYGKVKFRKAVAKIRGLTVGKPQEFAPEMTRLCFDAGVCLAITPAFKQARIRGMARWLRPGRPLIQLSLHGQTNDRFWLMFFYAAGSILLHRNKKMTFVDDRAALDEGGAGKAAYEFAVNALIPKKDAKRLGGMAVSVRGVREFSKELGIHPGIVAGYLQHGGRVSCGASLDRLKVRFPAKKRQPPAPGGGRVGSVPVAVQPARGGGADVAH